MGLLDGVRLGGYDHDLLKRLLALSRQAQGGDRGDGTPEPEPGEAGSEQATIDSYGGSA